MLKTSLTIELPCQEAEKYHRAIHRALCLLNDLPPLTAGAFDRAELRADLLRLAAMLDDAVVPPVPPPAYRTLPEFPVPPDLDALETFLSTLLTAQVDTLGDLRDIMRSNPRLGEAFNRRRERLWDAWHRFAETSQGEPR